jgi:hypothetical protein
MMMLKFSSKSRIERQEKEQAQACFKLVHTSPRGAGDETRGFSSSVFLVLRTGHHGSLGAIEAAEEASKCKNDSGTTC